MSTLCKLCVHYAFTERDNNKSNIMKTEITIMTGYHKDQPVTFKQTTTPMVYRRTQDNVQQSGLGSITTAHKWLVAWQDQSGASRKRYCTTLKSAVEYAGMI